MNVAPLLLADADWVKIGTMAVIGTIYLINFLAGKLKERAQRQMLEQRMPNRQPVADDKVASEIEEFLKKAANRESATASTGRDSGISGRDSAKLGRDTGMSGRDAASGRETAPAYGSNRNDPRNKQRKKTEERESRRKRPPNVLTPTLTEKPVTVEIMDESRRLTDHHVHSSIDDRKLQPSVTSDISRSERSMDQHIKQMFAHPVGSLTATETAVENNSTRAAAAAVASGTKANIPLATMLTGGNLKNAIVLNEILTRPEQRWERG